MQIKSAIVICSALFAAGAFAQAQLGKVTEVQGVVTVTDGVRGGTATVGAPITEGSRFVTSSNGVTTLVLDNGCTIRLRPNQAITVRNQACNLLLASVENLGATPVASGGLGRGAAVGLWAAGGAAILLNAFDNDNRSISPN